MKKSLLAILLMLCMVLGTMLVACGDDKPEESTKADESTSALQETTSGTDSESASAPEESSEPEESSSEPEESSSEPEESSSVPEESSSEPEESSSVPEESSSEPEESSSEPEESSSEPEESSSEPEGQEGDPTLEKAVSMNTYVVTPLSTSSIDRKAIDYLKAAVKDAAKVTLFNSVNEGMLASSGVKDYIRFALSTDMDASEYEVVGLDGNMTITAGSSLALYFGTVAAVDKWVSADGGFRDGKLYVSGDIAAKLNGLETDYDSLFTVMSQNVRCATSEDENLGLAPEIRFERFEKLLADVLPDVVGLQEVTREWYESIEEYYADLGYDVVWGETTDKSSREDAQYAPILYKADRFTLVDSGTIWLTTTPEQKSLVTGAATYSICTWAKLTDTVSGKTFMMLNAKFEEQNGDDTARTANMNALLGYLTQKGITGNIPTFFTCDLGAMTTAKAYTDATYSVFQSAHSAAERKVTPVNGTYHGYYGAGAQYDYIFYNRDIIWGISYETIAKSYFNDGNTLKPEDDGYDKAGYVSDHYAILGTFFIRDAQ